MYIEHGTPLFPEKNWARIAQRFFCCQEIEPFFSMNLFNKVIARFKDSM